MQCIYVCVVQLSGFVAVSVCGHCSFISANMCASYVLLLGKKMNYVGMMYAIKFAGPAYAGKADISRVSQNRIYTCIHTVYLVIFQPKLCIPYIYGSGQP
jgi:hypothetical protein